MDGNSLLELVLRTAVSLPETELCEYREYWQAVKVGGKWFAPTLYSEDQALTNLTGDPFDLAALTQSYSWITPGYHMNKRSWITLRPAPEVDAVLVEDLVVESYLQVVSRLPKRTRPLDLDDFVRNWLENHPNPSARPDAGSSSPR